MLDLIYVMAKQLEDLFNKSEEVFFLSHLLGVFWFKPSNRSKEKGLHCCG